jgi:hypothetical protein
MLVCIALLLTCCGIVTTSETNNSLPPPADSLFAIQDSLVVLDAVPRPNGATYPILLSTDKSLVIGSDTIEPSSGTPDVQRSCTQSLVLDIILGIIMAALGAFLAVWYEDTGHPRLILSIDDFTDGPRGNHGRVKFLHVAVRNHPWKVPFVSRKTAYACEANITFYCRDDSVVGPMPGRWSDNPEPLKYEVVNGQIQLLLDNALMAANRIINIPPLRSKRLDIAIRHATDRDAFGWTDTSYQYDWRHPQYRLSNDVYDVLVEASAEDRVFSNRFRLLNPVNIDNVRLDEI